MINKYECPANFYVNSSVPGLLIMTNLFVFYNFVITPDMLDWTYNY